MLHDADNRLTWLVYICRSHKFFLQLDGKKHLLECVIDNEKYLLKKDREARAFKVVDAQEFEKNETNFVLTLQGLIFLCSMAFEADSGDIRLKVEGHSFEALERAIPNCSDLFAVEIVVNKGREEVKGEYT